jgi:hypothetical protein
MKNSPTPLHRRPFITLRGEITLLVLGGLLTGIVLGFCAGYGIASS